MGKHEAPVCRCTTPQHEAHRPPPAGSGKFKTHFVSLMYVETETIAWSLRGTWRPFHLIFVYYHSTRVAKFCDNRSRRVTVR